MALFLIVLVETVNGIRHLKDAPELGPDSRLYKHSTQTTSAVQVQCTEDTMLIKVRADFYGNGHRVTTDQLQLGLLLTLSSSFLECCIFNVYFPLKHSRQIKTEDDNLVYANTLFYTPTPTTLGIVRSVGAAVRIQCHYKRNHFVSSNHRKTTWQQSLASSKPSPWFCLKLMTDDWTSERPSSVYHWRNVINLEASVLSADPTPVKLFLDSCVATPGPNSGSTSKYPLIHNHGSGSPDFYNLHTDFTYFNLLCVVQIYISCVLKVADAAQEENSVNKACTYSGNRYD
uniref:Zona pellucida sperm-binding protein 3 n=1 Tax=Electrophorus electricus TaxID=8005 RepID=A0A4W4ES29_ELEEL